MVKQPVASIIFFCLLAQFALGLDRYVSVNGSDITGTGSMLSPWKTIQYAIDATNGITTDTVNIHVAQGTYVESIAVPDGSLFTKICFYGGYDDSTIPWIREIDQFKTTINPPGADDRCMEVYWGIPSVIDGFYGSHGSFLCGNGYETGLVSDITILGEGGVAADIVGNCYIANGSVTARNKAEDNAVHNGRIWTGIDGIVRNNILTGPSHDNTGIRGLAVLIENNILIDFGAAILVEGDNAEVIGNRISNCGTGVYVTGTSVTVQGNVIEACSWGVYGDGQVVNNVIASCGTGMWGVGYSKNNIFWGNGLDYEWCAAPHYSWFDRQIFSGTGNIWGDTPGFAGWKDFSTSNPCWVDANYTGPESDGSSQKPFKTIKDALDALEFDYHLTSDSICIGTGEGGVDLGAFPEATTHSLTGGVHWMKMKVREGTYREKELEILSGITLEGEGKDKTVLEYPGGDQEEECLLLHTATKVTELGMKGTYGSGMFLSSNCRRTRIEGCRVEGCNYLAVEDANSGNWKDAEANLVLGNEFINNGGGILLWSGEIKNNEVRDNRGAGILGQWVIEGNRVIGNGNWGISISSWGGVVFNNVIAQNGQNGLILHAGEARNNIIWGNGLDGIMVSTISGRIINNSIWGNSDDGIGIEGEEYQPGYKNNEIVNNIIWGSGDKEIQDGLVASYCCVEGGYPGEGNLDLNPRFIYPAGGDFHLRFDSPCIDRGSTITFSSEDIDGDLRPYGSAPDIGADEYVGSASYQPLWDSLKGWLTETFPSMFTPPEFYTTQGLHLVSLNDIDTYGSWRTGGEISLSPGQLYELYAYVSSNVSEKRECPDFRLRVNFITEDEANFIRVSSIVNGEHSPKQGELLPYSFFFEPHISGEAYLSFDLINMDVSNYSQGALCLEEISVGEVSLSGSWQELRSWEFTSDEEGWHHDTVSQHIPTIGWWEAGELKIRAQDGSNTFGSWSSPLTLNVEPSTLYRATFTVRREEPSAMLCPALRFRLQDQTFEWSVLKTLVPVSTGSSVPDLTPTSYNVYFYLPSGAASPLLLSLDLYNFWERSHLPYCLDTVTVHKLSE